jgi:DNA repair protein RadA/Sms
MSKKLQVHYICQTCDYRAPKWLGKCPECQSWNSFVEEVTTKVTGKASKVESVISQNKEGPKKINEITKQEYFRTKSGIREFDRVVGEGVVEGSLILVGGEPGIGKSTLLTEVLGKFSKLNLGSVLYVSGEESASQIADRTRRLGISEDNFYIYNETTWESVLDQINKLKPRFIVLDSIQTIVSSKLESAPGTVSQIREVTYELMNHVKSQNITCFVIGHITKEGTIAGPKILEHMVDTVIYFEGDQFGQYRILRAIKNRFGNTNEVGLFEMGEKGLNEVLNPSQYFLTNEIPDAFGRSLSCILEGTRSLFVEIQALVVENKFGNGRRTTQGFDHNRLSMLIAIIEKYFGIPLGFNDVYLNVVGGIKVTTRETDLSVIASLLSSYKGKSIPSDTIFLGELGLTGEVRPIPQIEIRLKEMEQLKYKKLITATKIAKEYQSKYPTIKMIGLTKASDLAKYLD